MPAKPFWNLLGLCASMIATWGCASALTISRIDDAPLLENRSKASIRFYKAGESAPPNYKILGKIFAYKRAGTIFDKPSDASLMKMMRTPAARMGADAVIAFHSSIFNGKEYNSIRRWGSALAVKIDSVENFPENMQSDLIIAIAPPHLKTGHNLKTNVEQALNEAAQYYLERKGYYAVIFQKQQLVTSAQFESMDAEAQLRFGDARAGLVLFMTLEDVGYSGGITSGRGGALLSAILFSKQTRKAVWRNAAMGSSFTYGMLTTIYHDHQLHAIYDAVENVFGSLATRAQNYYPGQ